jgi:hypothetical protein
MMETLYSNQDLAETVVYNGVEVRALVTRGEREVGQGNISAVTNGTWLVIAKSAVPNPAEGDEVVFADGSVMVIDGFESKNGRDWDMGAI